MSSFGSPTVRQPERTIASSYHSGSESRTACSSTASRPTRWITIGPGTLPCPIELPAFVQPGQHDAAVAIALGYGRAGTDRFASVGPPWFEARALTGPRRRQRLGAGYIATEDRASTPAAW